VLPLVAAILLLFACDRRATPHREHDAPVARFWRSFAQDAATLRRGEPRSAMDAAQRHLRREGFAVMAEVEPSDPTWTLVITADGDKALFPEVERVVAGAPSIEGWNVVGFRQRIPIAGMKFEMDGVELAVDDVRVVALRSADKLDVQVFLPGYNGEGDTFPRLVFIALDHAVGEKDMETRIGGIDWLPLAEAPPTARPLTELPVILDRAFAAP